MTTVEWILGWIGAAVWIAVVAGLIYCLVWLAKNLPYISETEARHEQLMHMICAQFNVTATDFMGRSKLHPLPEARMIFSYLANSYFNDTFETVAHSLKRDHSTISYQITKMRSFIKAGDPVARKVCEIENRLRTESNFLNT